MYDIEGEQQQTVAYKNRDEQLLCVCAKAEML